MAVRISFDQVNGPAEWYELYKTARPGNKKKLNRAGESMMSFDTILPGSSMMFYNKQDGEMTAVDHIGKIFYFRYSSLPYDLLSPKL